MGLDTCPLGVFSFCSFNLRKVNGNAPYDTTLAGAPVTLKDIQPSTVHYYRYYITALSTSLLFRLATSILLMEAQVLKKKERSL